MTTQSSSLSQLAHRVVADNKIAGPVHMLEVDGSVRVDRGDEGVLQHTSSQGGTVRLCWRPARPCATHGALEDDGIGGGEGGLARTWGPQGQGQGGQNDGKVGK